MKSYLQSHLPTPDGKHMELERGSEEGKGEGKSLSLLLWRHVHLCHFNQTYVFCQFPFLFPNSVWGMPFRPFIIRRKDHTPHPTSEEEYPPLHLLPLTMRSWWYCETQSRQNSCPAANLTHLLWSFFQWRKNACLLRTQISTLLW
jgi:hypothetical protein